MFFRRRNDDYPPTGRQAWTLPIAIAIAMLITVVCQWLGW